MLSADELESVTLLLDIVELELVSAELENSPKEVEAENTALSVLADVADSDKEVEVELLEFSADADVFESTKLAEALRMELDASDDPRFSATSPTADTPAFSTEFVELFSADDADIMLTAESTAVADIDSNCDVYAVTLADAESAEEMSS